MYFQISKTKQDNFPHNHQNKKFIISLDEGWSHTKDIHCNDIWYKGYLDQGSLSDHIEVISQEESPKHSGNFCIIKVFDRGVIIRSDMLRSFPIWHNHQLGLTNLSNIGDIFWTDSYVMMHNDLSIIHSKFDSIGEIDDNLVSYETVVDEIDEILNKKIKDFIFNLKTPIRIFLSGGIDTTTIFSYVQKHTKNYELIPYTHCDFDYFYLKNHGTLSKFWGYNQIHHWKESCILASGAPGDEFTMRSPTTANLMLLHYGTSIPKLLKDPTYTNCLHAEYFNNQNYFNLWQDQQKNYKASSLRDVIYQGCNNIVNDWQHWHLGNTLTWTPLRDLRIFKLISKLPVEHLKEQVMNSVIQQKLIKRNNPDIINYLSDHKNSKNSFANLTNIL
jgi:hypothetical protein